MKISIAMTTYNGEKYLKRQIESIISQTYSDFELVICDDNSSDNTIKILEEYKLKDDRIKIYKNEYNLGFKKNFEKVIKLCVGEFIALCDQDDIWTKTHLEILLNKIENASASVGNALIMDEYDVVTSDFLSDRDRYFIDGNCEYKLSRILLYGNPFQGTSSLYTKDLFDKALPIPEGIEYHDAWFSACACCLNGLNYTFDIVTNYRIHSSNVSGNHKINLIKQIKTTLNRGKYKTDRLIFVSELRKRIPTMNNNYINLLSEVEGFYLNRSNNKRIKVIIYLIKNYKKIYSINNYKQVFLRCVGVLIWG